MLKKITHENKRLISLGETLLLARVMDEVADDQYTVADNLLDRFAYKGLAKRFGKKIHDAVEEEHLLDDDVIYDKGFIRPGRGAAIFLRKAVGAAIGHYEEMPERVEDPAIQEDINILRGLQLTLSNKN